MQNSWQLFKYQMKQSKDVYVLSCYFKVKEYSQRRLEVIYEDYYKIE